MYFFKGNIFSFVYSTTLVTSCISLISLATFRDIVHTRYFVDKTLLIERILNDSTDIFFTGTWSTGRTINLCMLKHFFQLQAQTNAKGDMVGKIEETSNYQLFVENNLKITRNAEIMKKYFGRYPVIWIDLKFNLRGKKLATIIQDFGLKVHRIFIEHGYLVNSSKISEKSKAIYRKWMDENKFKKFVKQDVSVSLLFLSHLLFLHFNKKCILLVDNVDELVSEHLYSNEPLSMLTLGIERLNFLTEIFHKLLFGYHRFVERGIFTGLSSIYLNSLLEKFKIETRSFARDDKYVEFNGFTSAEMYDLLVRYGVIEERRKKLLTFYKAYSYKNTSIYNPFSSVQYLLSGKMRTYWRDVAKLWDCSSAFKNTRIEDAVTTLLRNGSVVFKFEKATNKNLERLMRYVKNTHLEEFYDLWFSYLLECGFVEQVFVKEQGAPGKPSKIEIKFTHLENAGAGIGIQLMWFYRKYNNTDRYEAIRQIVNLYPNEAK